MQSGRFRIVTASVTLLLAALLGAVILLTLRTAHPAPRPTAIPITPVLHNSAAVTATVAAAAATPDLAPAETVTLGGFSYRVPAGFAVTSSETSVTLTGQPTGNDLATIFLLSGGPSAQFVAEPSAAFDAMFDQFVAYFAEQDHFTILDKRQITVDRVDARMVDLVSKEDQEPYAGRIVMAQPAADRLFVMTGIAPQTAWETRAATQFDAVLASIVLERSDPVAAAPATPTTGSLLVPTATPTDLSEPTRPPTATPIPTTQPLPTPDPAAVVDTQGSLLANGNFVAGLAVTNNALWAATDGGIVAWNRTGGFVTFSTLKGLALNHFTAVTYCPLPGLGIVFGTDGGLQIFDARNGTWNTLTSANSAMSFDDVSTVQCSLDEKILTVGYRQHGLDFYDAGTNTWSHLDKNDGLASDFVDHVAVIGNRAEIWTASGFGVSVVTDGRGRSYTSANSALTGNRINALLAGADGAVWIVEPAALHRIQNGQWTTLTAKTASSFPTGALTALGLEPNNIIWIGTADGEVCRFELAEGSCSNLWRAEAGMAPGPITDLLVEDGAVYYATAGNGISSYDANGWRRRDIPGELLAHNSVRSMVQDANGFVWIATEVGVQQISAENPVISRLIPYGAAETPLDNVQVMVPDRVGGIWFGGLGATHFDGKKWRSFTTVDGLAGSIVQALVIDLQRRVWIGTKTGLSIWNGETFFNLTQENGLPNDNVLTLLAEGDAIWIGSNGGGLYRFERNQLQIYNRVNAELPSDTITALAVDEDGLLVVGTDRGVVQFDGEKAVAVNDVPAVTVTAVATRGGRIWVATERDGLYLFDGASWQHQTVNAGLPSLALRALLVDSYETIWVGGSSGGVVRSQIER